jgi:hypothetical protein
LRTEDAGKLERRPSDLCCRARFTGVDECPFKPRSGIVGFAD